MTNKSQLEALIVEVGEKYGQTVQNLRMDSFIYAANQKFQREYSGKNSEIPRFIRDLQELYGVSDAPGLAPETSSSP